MARVVRQTDGSYIAIKDDGSRVPMTTEMLAGARPTRVLNEQGITGPERFFLKNFASNPEAAQDFLRSHGYEVRPYGDHPLKMQFAIRKNATDPWRVVDPDGFEPEDLLDLSVDALIGLGIGGAVAATGGAGLLAAAAAGSVAGAGFEATRQVAGTPAFGAQNIDPTQIALAGGAGAAGEFIGAGARAAGRSISKLALDIGSRVAGVRASGGIAADEALSEYAAARAQKLKFPTFREAADELFKYLKDRKTGILSVTFPETQAMNESLGQAKQAGLRFDLSDVLENMENFTATAGANVARTTERKVITEATRKATTAAETASESFGKTRNVLTNAKQKAFDVAREAETITGREATTSAEATTKRTVIEPSMRPKNLKAASLALSEGDPTAVVQRKLDDIMNVVTIAAEQDGVPADIRSVSPEIVDLLRQNLQAFARKQGVYNGSPITLGAKQIFKDAAKAMRQKLLDGMSSFPEFADNLAKSDLKMRARAELVKAMQSPAVLSDYIQKVYGKQDSRALRAIMDVEKQFGIEGQIQKRIRLAQVASQVGKKGPVAGKLSAFPRLSATGLPILLPAAMMGGPAGFAGGLIATSPKTIVMATRFGQMAAAVAKTPAVSVTAHQAAIQSLRQTALAVGKGMARERDTRRPRRRVVIGGA